MELQMQRHRQIRRFLENFKKIGRKNYTPAMVRSRTTSLKEIWQQFSNDNALLERSVSETTKPSVGYFAEGIFEATEEIYHFALDQMNEVLEELEPPASANRSVDTSNNHSNPSAFTTSHLPVIQLPPFDGCLTEWELFRDRFTAVIIENKELHDFARMHYLVTFLRGRALECIQELPISAENFEVAWQALRDRFDNKRRILAAHMSALLSLPRLSRESAIELQSLRSKVKMTLASLTHLNRSPADLWNDMIVHLVSQSLDTVTRRSWKMRVSDRHEPFSYEHLDRFLAERVIALEDITREPVRPSVGRSSGPSRVHAAVSSSSSPACPLCNSRHFFSACPRFVSADSSKRLELVRKHRRCFNCLSPRHSSPDCVSTFSCRTCHLRHHSLLHEAIGSNSRVAKAIPTSNAGDPAEEPNSGACVMVAATDVRRRVPVLLATARIRVRSADGRVGVARALLDQGSEVTLVSERFAQLL